MQPREGEAEWCASRDSWGQRCKGQAEEGGAGGHVVSHQPREGFPEGMSFRVAIPLPVPDTQWALNECLSDLLNTNTAQRPVRGSGVEGIWWVWQRVWGICQTLSRKRQVWREGGREGWRRLYFGWSWVA